MASGARASIRLRSSTDAMLVRWTSTLGLPQSVHGRTAGAALGWADRMAFHLSYIIVRKLYDTIEWRGKLSDSLPAPKALEEAVALIVGGTAGVGLESARRLLAAGVPKVAIVGRDAARGERALQSLDGGERVTFIAGDARTADGAMQIVGQVTAWAGTIDILLNCTAPAVLPDLFHRTNIEEIQPILDQLALPPMLMTAAALPMMREQRGGVIVNVASDAGKSATPGEAVIGAGMAAIVMFSRTVAMEAKRDGVRVNVLTPSLISGTETSARILESGFSQKLFEKAATMASLGVADAGDLADLVVFLASPGARRLTGQAISVNGGISAA